MGADKDKIYISSNSKASATAKFTFKLVAEIHYIVVEKFDCFSIRESVFKVDDDGEYSSLNVGKFLSDSVKAGIMTQDSDNYSVNSDVTLEKWAKKLNLSASTVKAILGELEEYGAEFKFF